MVRDSKPEAITLAIGDGANDVNMISGAHIGVGIKGLEGSQAARISDFAIGEFKLLRRLVLGYGRECYRVNSDLIGYFFYKNMIIVLPQIWISYLTGFSGQVVYEPFIFEFYNVMFTSLPVLVYALFDREYDLDILMNSHTFYKLGQSNELFTTNYIFTRWVSRAAFQSVLLCFFAYVTIEYNFLAGGMLFDYWTTGMAIFSGIIVVANLELFNLHNFHSPLTILIIFGSIFSYFATLSVFGMFKGNPLYQIFHRLVSTPQFYAYMTVGIYICCVLSSSIFKINALFGKVQLGKGMRMSLPGPASSDFKRRYTGFAYSG